MSQHPTCPECNAGRPDLQGICTECDGCFRLHCDCTHCAHGKSRVDDCVFCARCSTPLLEMLIQAADIESDLRWLVGHEEELS